MVGEEVMRDKERACGRASRVRSGVRAHTHIQTEKSEREISRFTP